MFKTRRREKKNSPHHETEAASSKFYGNTLSSKYLLLGPPYQEITWTGLNHNLITWQIAVANRFRVLTIRPGVRHGVFALAGSDNAILSVASDPVEDKD